MIKIRFIDLIRVLGLVLVLFYHLFEEFLPGGFLGVDIFFVVSGYLITAMIISEFEQKNQFQFMCYIKRRLNRIFPPLLFMLITTLPFIKLIPDDFTANISKQISAVLGFATNYFEIVTGGSYETKFLPHLYVHTWTLSLEVAYYLFWGGFCTLIIRMFASLGEGVKTKVIKYTCVSSALIIGMLSYINMQYLFTNNLNKSVAYLATTSHIFPFFIGSIVGILFGFKISDKVSSKLRERSKFFRNFSLVMLVVSLASIVTLVCRAKFGSVFVYRHGFLIVSVLASLAIVAARVLHEVVSCDYEESAVISHLSDLSYAIYLFHWPFYIVFSNSLPDISIISTLIFTYAFSLIVCYLVDSRFYSRYHIESNYKYYKKLLCIVVTVCIFIDIGILINQKEITSLEKEQMVGNIVQNIDKLENLKIGINNLNEDPIVEREGIYNFDILEISSIKKQKVSLTPIPDEKKVEEELVNVHIVPEEGKTILVDNGSKVISDSQENVSTPSTNPVCTPNSVTVIGDSVALGARKSIIDNIPNAYVDTKQNRNLQQGYSLIMEMQQQGILGEYLVVVLGTNECNAWKSSIDKIINDLEPGHRLLFVTPYDGRWNPSWISYKTTEYLRSIKDAYSYVTIIDWAAEVSANPSLVEADKIHIGGYVKGIKAFTNKIIEGIEEASKKSPK